MTRQEMRTMMRRRLRDTNSVTWKNADTDDELNLAARRVERKIGRQQKINYDLNTETITTTADTVAYDLSASDFRRVWKMQRTDSTPNQACKQMDESNQSDWRQLGVRDRQGQWLFFITRTSTTYTVNFPQAPPAGLTFTLTYLTLTSEIATGTAGDANDLSSFSSVIEDYHELIVQDAIVALMDPASSLYTGAAIHLAKLNQDMLMDVTTMSDPVEITETY